MTHNTNIENKKRENKMTEKTKANFRELARKGFGDDSIYDQADILWIVFRLPQFFVYVKVSGADYTDVKASI